MQLDGHGSEVLRVAEAVDAAYAGDYDCVVSADDAADSVHSHLFYLLVYAGVFFDVRVRCGHVGLGLVVVVEADEVLHSVVGE